MPLPLPHFHHHSSPPFPLPFLSLSLSHNHPTRHLPFRPRLRLRLRPPLVQTPIRKFASTMSSSTSTSPPTATATKHEFIVILPDREGVLEKRMSVRQNHLDAIKPKVEAGFWRFGGAMLTTPLVPDHPPQMRGSVMLALAASEEEVWAQIREDVYAREGVWDLERVQVWPFKTAVKNL